ncbi:tRNA dihydrouridine synthase DusB [Buchananella hordeovulneris]|uniref:tRNA dihydrouridine synthase DusB n=1 Tax=Buchananella hordeovulneris TaxID=52770 RepID=A0A1Q5PX89_9ACTO|nr:tRNA dihydrouridine synthase DusB [Buchananella hordeovulneris]
MTLQIGPLQLGVPLVLAPMAGVTNMAFRRLCREQALSALPPGGPLPAPGGGTTAPAGLFVTEMVTSRALVERHPGSLRMTESDPTEFVRSVQLYGVDPATIARAIDFLVREDRADHIDLNFGCPVPKVTRKGGGSALPWKRDLFAAIVTQAVAAAEAASRGRSHQVPVTVKMRMGIDDTHLTYVEAAQTAERAGVAAVALHARTTEQYYSGAARWEHVARLVEAVNIPVLGNGDIFAGDDAARLLAESGCAGVVVGRGCQGRPWLFADLVYALTGSEQRMRPHLRDVAAMIVRHAELLIPEFRSEEKAMREMRKHIGWYLKGFAVGGPQRRDLQLVSTLAELRQRLAALELDQVFPPGAEGPRGRAGTAKTPHLPHGWLASRELAATDRQLLLGAEVDTSGG